ncbi:MAG: YbhB/YbcL family Raf kinase inhibitor-like protein [Sedimentisphaerales bacterium]|nr:YbhB/YbcL family Raf kinase inhibitor-like protein [Sedimentisphaerales bacterium]
MDITSTAFGPGQAIPSKYTGEGADVSPELHWDNLPNGTKQLALICDDPDAPGSQPWVHWVIYRIPSVLDHLPEGVGRSPRPAKPAGALQGKNSWPSDNIGYRGPMPPVGHGTHHYRFRLYALDGELNLEPGLDKPQLLEAMAGHILAEAELVGTYER